MKHENNLWKIKQVRKYMTTFIPLKAKNKLEVENRVTPT